MTQITAFGARALYVLAGSLCGIWALRRNEIRRVENELWPRVMAVLWICANAVAFMVKLILVTFHSRYSKMANMLDQSPSLIPLERDTISEDENTTKAAGLVVQPDSRTREEPDLNQTLYVIETETENCRIQTINLLNNGIHRGTDGLHRVAAPWRDCTR